MDDFDTEEDYDTLTGVNSAVEYSGSSGPEGVSVAAGESFLWKSDDSSNAPGFKICWRPPKCVHANGTVENSAASNCSCGSASCSTETGFFCNANFDMCSKTATSTCAINNGSLPNDGACTCGTSFCASADSTGLYCTASLDRCAKKVLCGKNERVVQNACLACDEGYFRPGEGDDPAGEDTACTAVAFTATSPCTASESCVQSPNYPSNYGDDQECTIRTRVGGLLHVKAFETEEGFETLQHENQLATFETF